MTCPRRQLIPAGAGYLPTHMTTMLDARMHACQFQRRGCKRSELLPHEAAWQDSPGLGQRASWQP